MTDIEIAREAAASAQANPDVAKLIRSGKFDGWPNVQGALIAIASVDGKIRDAVEALADRTQDALGVRP